MAEVAQKMPSGEERHAARQESKKRMEEHADRVAGLYWQRQRIIEYLPTLYEQRDESQRRLADLIRDEERAVEDIAAEIA